MHFRTRHRIHAVPLVVVASCLAIMSAIATVPKLADALRDQMVALPIIAICVAALGPLAFLIWYTACYCEIRRGELRMRWFFRRQAVNLRELEFVEVCAAGRRKLSVHLGDTAGGELFLPLGAWRDEDLIMARVLRATVECKQRIDGDPEIVKEFSGLLETYKSWDRRLTAA